MPQVGKNVDHWKSRTLLLKYPKIDEHTLQIQIQMFRQQFQYKTVQEAATMFRSFVPEVRCLFSQVEVLLILIHVIPLTSCEAERSFSALRRLKTWLRSTMSQKRLNNIAVCHVHHDYIDDLKLESIVNEFISANERRLKLFGKF